MNNITKKDILIKELQLLLGHDLVDVELDDLHYHTAIVIALDRFRQRSDGSTSEKDIFLEIQPEVQEYKLPDEVQEVRRLYRRGVGGFSSGGINFDPVDSALMNTYLMNSGNSGGLATWDFYNQYLETVERQFASQYNFVWEPVSKILRILRKPKAQEQVMVSVWCNKSDDMILTDVYSKPWIRSYALAIAKQMLGQGRGKYAGGIPGPQGSVTLNGSDLIQQAQAEIEKLDDELNRRFASRMGYGFVIG